MRVIILQYILSHYPLLCNNIGNLSFEWRWRDGRRNRKENEIPISSPNTDL